ncbi:embryonic protein UVS.2-like [Anomaloglossus baeobatrachus]|uniref:embryonic protein UVS.2-like n=1 Tax=Anomaloglossus baeobatrachus TaxID=238106 RepID=UPI003F50C09C
MSEGGELGQPPDVDDGSQGALPREGTASCAPSDGTAEESPASLRPESDGVGLRRTTRPTAGIPTQRYAQDEFEWGGVSGTPTSSGVECDSLKCDCVSSALGLLNYVNAFDYINQSKIRQSDELVTNERLALSHYSCKTQFPEKSIADVKEEEEFEGIFTKILKANKANSLPIQNGDILVKSGRNAVICTSCLWPKSADGTVIVPYVLSAAYNDDHRKLFQNSMDEFESLTCVRFVPQTVENSYANIVSGGGCYSIIGRTGGGQAVGVDISGCMYKGIIQHELNHVLGFVHEHMRSDRDSYVTIMYQYISPGDTGNFNKENTNNLGIEYDYSSVMHYDKYAYSNTSGQPTIVPIPDPNVPIGQRDGLSVLDVSKINLLYQCNVCSNLLIQSSGSLTSANYPSAYPTNYNCVWLFRIPSYQVSLTFVAFDVQSSPNCASDYIKIYDGPTKRHPVLIDRTCGSGVVPPIISSSNQLLIEFSSDGSITGTGFKASYATVSCGGTFYTPGRNITSPRYPSNYYSNLKCNYTIKAPVGQRITLTFNDFKLEDSYMCIYDYVIVWDGSIQYGQFCGVRSIPVITSTTNTLVINFKTDVDTQTSGFLATYTFRDE